MATTDFVAMTVLEMDPGIIVTIFSNREGPMGPAGAELVTLREVVSGCPTESARGDSHLTQVDHVWNDEELLLRRGRLRCFFVGSQ